MARAYTYVWKYQSNPPRPLGRLTNSHVIEEKRHGNNFNAVWRRKYTFIDGWLRMGLLPPLGNFADISYLVENWKPSLLRNVCTLAPGR